MRRIEIITAVNNVIETLVDCRIQETIQSVIIRPGERAERSPSLPIDAMRKYFLAAEKFGSIENEIIRILDLEELNSIEFWAAFTTLGMSSSARENSPRDSGGQERVASVFGKVNFTLKQLPVLVALLERRDGGFSADIISEPSAVIGGKSVISTIVIENENEYSKPLRLSGLFESINDLYEVCAAVNEEQGNDLMIVACDSGSDKSFDFMGSAKIVEALKELILSIWDRAVFFREHKMSAHLDIVSQALPIIDQISTMEEQGKLGPEEAQILRQKVTNSAGKFLEVGVIIPEMESVSTQSPRALMAPEPKQLVASESQPGDPTDTGGTSPGGEFQIQSEFDIKNMSPEERMRLLFQLQDEATGDDDDREVVD